MIENNSGALKNLKYGRGTNKMAQNTFDEMMENEAFRIFFAKFQDSANYFVASKGDISALKICIAYAFKQGLESQAMRIEDLQEANRYLANSVEHFKTQVREFEDYYDRHKFLNPPSKS